MVQLRLIQGGKLDEELVFPRVRLFSACSVVDHFHGRDGVRLNWICVERQKPVVPYDRLIDGYDQLDARVRPYFEDHIKELFTEEEITALDTYLLETLGSNLHIQEETVPASSVFIPMPYREIKRGEGRGFFHLPDEAAPALGFKVCAYFDLRCCPPSVTLSKEAAERGIDYLEEALKGLGLADRISRPQLEATVEALYDSRGLSVDQGKSREERCRERDSFLKPGSGVPPHHE